MTRLLALALVLTLGCSGSSSTESDAGTDSGANRDSSIFVGIDAGNDAGTDSGAPDSGMGVDAGMGAGTDAGPCDCAAVGPCCDGCHAKPAGTICALTDSLTMPSGCLIGGAHVRKNYDVSICDDSGSCGAPSPGYVYWNCTGPCPANQTCDGSCITSGLDRCVTYAGCDVSTPQAYRDFGTCP